MKKLLKTKKGLILTTIKLFIKYHPIEVTAEKIAIEHGIRKPSIFYHYRSMMNLYACVIKHLTFERDFISLNIIYSKIQGSDFEKKLENEISLLKLSSRM